MVGIGLILIGFAIAGLVLRKNGRYWQSPLFLKALTWVGWTPFVALLSGWIVTEVGRAPWLVHGIMNHHQGVTPALTGGMALFSLIGYITAYALDFWAGTYYLLRVMDAVMDVKNTRSEERRVGKEM